jgi:peptidoglycan-N-acetylglucosamine deacetylase
MGRIVMYPGLDRGPRETDMKRSTYITTSWDDGHPLDLRVAELLAKYGLPGTFYVPMTAECETMTVAQIRELSSAFEIGAHTLHHVDLTGATKATAWQEIVDSKSWIEGITGAQCPMFCPPKGRYFGRHLHMIREAGYRGVRTVELLSLDFPRPVAGLLLLPTTVQAHQHGLPAYARNVVKRAAFRNLWQYIAHGRSTDWPTLVRSLLGQALKRGGVFHLWGHSWELEENGQWRRLDEVLRFMSQFSGLVPGLTNLQVCQQAQSRNEVTNENVRNAGVCRGSLITDDAHIVKGTP